MPLWRHNGSSHPLQGWRLTLSPRCFTSDPAPCQCFWESRRLLRPAGKAGWSSGPGLDPPGLAVKGLSQLAESTNSLCLSFPVSNKLFLRKQIHSVSTCLHSFKPILKTKSERGAFHFSHFLMARAKPACSPRAEPPRGVNICHSFICHDFSSVLPSCSASLSSVLPFHLSRFLVHTKVNFVRLWLVNSQMVSYSRFPMELLVFFVFSPLRKHDEYSPRPVSPPRAAPLLSGQGSVPPPLDTTQGPSSERCLLCASVLLIIRKTISYLCFFLYTCYCILGFFKFIFIGKSGLQRGET